MPNVAVQNAKSWHHFTKITHIHILARLQRQGIRRSCRDPTCLGKITFLVNFQVNGYGTSQIVLYVGVFDPQGCDTGVMHVRWQYILLPLTKFGRKFSLLVHACLSHNRQIKNCFQEQFNK